MIFDPNKAAAEGSGIFGLQNDESDARVIVLPVPFDATTSYRKGAARGPSAVFEASKQVDLFDYDTGRPYEEGIYMIPESSEVQAWNREATEHAARIIELGGEIGDDPSLQASLRRVNEISALVDKQVQRETTRLLEAGKIVATLGGDHSVPFGAIAAHADYFTNLGVLHFDAHADLREAYEGFECSHASIMHNVVKRVPGVQKLVQVGIRDFCEDELRMIRNSKGRIATFFDRSLKSRLHEGTTWRAICRQIVSELPQHVYVSFDIDGLEPSLCPNTGTPVPGGLSFDQALELLSTVVDMGRTIVGVDLNEVSPDPEGKHDWDANVGARLLYKLIGWALVSQGFTKRNTLL